jgi:hypothetical protein
MRKIVRSSWAAWPTITVGLYLTACTKVLEVGIPKKSTSHFEIGLGSRNFLFAKGHPCKAAFEPTSPIFIERSYNWSASLI